MRLAEPIQSSATRPTSRDADGAHLAPPGAAVADRGAAALPVELLKLLTLLALLRWVSAQQRASVPKAERSVALAVALRPADAALAQHVRCAGRPAPGEALLGLARLVRRLARLGGRRLGQRLRLVKAKPGQQRRSARRRLESVQLAAEWQAQPLEASECAQPAADGQLAVRRLAVLRLAIRRLELRRW